MTVETLPIMTGVVAFGALRGHVVKVRYEHPDRPGMASYARGVSKGPRMRPDRGWDLILDGHDPIPVESVESVEFEGGLREARRAKETRCSS